ncbi:Prefoldin subunit-domain-containing protein [Coniella lustricola]|uniref:Prefoldin subunit-domain-containing protein n=1 Tax=Coniella lustricola TaxID=2025994 RepID=A0A2T3A9U9_9PEZI|nr:Prefoldin subunit-domain-containing protein [Coniella lustricola]
MAAVKDHFIDLERHRLQLENSVTKLQRALQHWRMSDAEYEQLKDEVEAIHETASREDLERIREEFEGEVVTDKEVSELLFGSSSSRDSSNAPKSTRQIINILSRRIDYVSKNVETLEKQLAAAEQKLAAATVLVNPDVRDEEGLPITDIIEQLDEDDNVTTYHLQRPGDLQPQIQEALAKAGIDELPEGGEEVEAQLEPEASSSAQAETKAANDSDDASVEFIEDVAVSTAQDQHQPMEEVVSQAEAQRKRPSTKRGVSFTEDTKPGHDSATDVVPPLSKTAQRLGEIMDQAREQALPIDDPIIPQEESAEDAEMRREMLRYSMEEIAPIVAELEIDEGGNSDFDDAYEFDDDEDYDEEDEDEYGRSKYRAVNDDYRARMEELQQKLGIKSMRELAGDGKHGEEEEEDEEDGARNEGIGRITIQPAVAVKSALKTEDQETNGKSAKKGVKFADVLDVAPAPDSSSRAVTEVSEPEEPFVDPMKMTIVERGASVQPTAVSEHAVEPKKVSRFKKAKAAGIANTLPSQQTPAIPKGPADAPVRFLAQEEVQTAPTGPEGKTLAGTILERETPAGVKEPDEFNAALIHQEAATEYHRMRNRMILKEGGFTRDTEAPIEWPEEEEGGKRISRFKAARLARG